ncbi:hypothetical protein L6164_013443 [Bauhinia variegata]|uniref:Uncharacterized protein n=1 Tax=Bauhinia variegata TaxID=167791 RepID=A0ACB9NER4_BAUVA|nr:hypothetical protein L6164_013443 [Bauhinia variegata]
MQIRFEKVLFDSCNNLHWHSLCCTVWPYINNELYFGDFYCVHLNAPVLFASIKSQRLTTKSLVIMCGQMIDSHFFPSRFTYNNSPAYWILLVG